MGTLGPKVYNIWVHGPLGQPERRHVGVMASVSTAQLRRLLVVPPAPRRAARYSYPLKAVQHTSSLQHVL